MTNHTTEAGTINSVTVYAVALQTTGDEFLQLAVRTGGTDYFSASTAAVATTYTTYSNAWATNPNTLVAWTWADIDALEAGVKSIRNGASWTGEEHVTQVYAVVDYTPSTLTLANGPERPAASTTGPAATDKLVEQFTLTASTGTASVTQIVITLGGTGTSHVTTVKLYRDAGTLGQLDGETALGSVAPSGGTATFTGLTESVGTSAVRYLVSYTYSGGTNGDTLTADATGATATGYTTTDNSTASNAVTIDANSPALITNFTATSGQDSQVPLAWTNPTDAALAEVVVRRNTGSYPTGHTTGTQVYQNLSPVSGGAVNTTDSTGPPVNGTMYYYAIYSRDSYNNWNDTTTPGSNAATATPQAVPVAVTLSASSVSPASIAQTETKAFLKFGVTTSTGNSTLTSLTVNKLGTITDGDVQWVGLWRSADGFYDGAPTDTLIASRPFSGGTLTFAGLNESISTSVVNWYFVTVTPAYGADTSKNVGLRIPANGFTVSAGTPSNSQSDSGTSSITAKGGASGTGATVTIVNPRDGGLVTDSVKVQVLVWVPAGLGTLSSLSLSTSGGDSYGISFNLANQPTGDRNTNYNYGSNSAVYEKTLSLADGTYTLKAQAVTGAGTATSRAVTVNAMAGRGDARLLVRDNSSQLCADCHALNTHSSQFTSTSYGNWSVVCMDCHTPHSTTNIGLIRESVRTPNSGLRSNVYLRNKTGDAQYSYADSTNTTYSYNNICQVCHTQTKNPSTSTARWRNSGTIFDAHYTVGAGTQACVGCHSHSEGFKPGESGGNTPCQSCHSAQFSPMNTTSGYHHYMNNADIGYPNIGQPAALGGTGDTNRKCLMCHVDHNIFRTDLNPSSPGRSSNLRTDISTTPTTTAGYTNTDFSSTGNGGICLSCHKTTQNKSYTQPDTTTSTPVIPFSGGAPSDYAASPHGAYTVPSTFTKDSSTFAANCSKCHNDTLSKGMQGSTNKFGLHDSTLRRMLSPLGISSPTDPLEEQFCLQCHAGGVAGNDYYGAASMSQSAKRLEQYLKSYTTGSAAFTSGSTTVTGTGTTWRYAGTATFTLNSNQVTSVSGVALSNALIGWSIRNTAITPVTWYTIVKVDTGTNTLTISPSYREATAASAAMAIAIGDWLIRDETNKIWSRVVDVTSATALTIYPPSSVTASGTYTARSEPGHPMVLTSGIHKPVEGGASGWNPGGATRHVVCEDCHNPHAAKAGNHTIGSDTIGSPNLGTWGVSVTYAAAKTGTANFTSASQTVTWVSGNQFASTDVNKNLKGPDGLWYQITAYTSATQISIGTSGVGYKGTTGSGAFTIGDPTTAPTLARVDPLTASNKQYQLCLKCHSAYAWGAGAVPTTTYFNASGYGISTQQSDISKDFNPSQFAHHAIMGQGNNQPPVTANTAWGTGGTGAPGAKKSTYGPSSTANPNSGLDNNFVDGWGRQSLVTCSDCHGSSSPEDPEGPHGSANQWILRSIEPNITATINTGTQASPVWTETKPNRAYYKGSNYVYSGTGMTGFVDTGDTKNFCLNCHRADVYGMVSAGGATTIPNNPDSGAQYSTFARVRHPVDNRTHSNASAANTGWSALGRWGMFCMQCHGGYGLGNIHGSNLGKAVGGVGGTSYGGKRFLTGTAWRGVTRATTTAAVACWIPSAADALNTCTRGHTGDPGNTANYTYDSGAD